MTEPDPEIMRQYHEKRAKETAERLMMTEAAPEDAAQAKELLHNGAQQAAEMKSKTRPYLRVLAFTADVKQKRMLQVGCNRVRSRVRTRLTSQVRYTRRSRTTQ